jgi:pimeloyl-ACP methyl ester carboxylesterase
MRADKMPEGDIKAAQREVSGARWFRDYVHRLGPGDVVFGKKNIAYDGRAALEGVKCPVLVLVGGRDTIVPAKKGAALLEAIVKKAGNKDVTTRTFAGADHFMHAARTGGPREMFAKGRKKEFVPGDLAAITGWLAPRVRPVFWEGC